MDGRRYCGGFYGVIEVEWLGFDCGASSGIWMGRVRLLDWIIDTTLLNI